MSKTIDSRVVEMSFDNRNFESNVQTSLSTLDKLKRSLNFENATKGLDDIDTASKNLDFGVLSGAVDTVKEKFSVLDAIAFSALQNITNKAIDTGERLIKSLSTDQITAGWGKYADKTTAVQTIMSATASTWEENAKAIGFMGNQMDFVTDQLEKLNWFSDETSYSFTDMTSNIGKFTSNGVALTDAVQAMQGISTWAAKSGQNTQSASRAMYNLAQAMAVGSVKLIDWKSIENANMATTEFKQTAIDTAEQLGTLKKVEDGLWKTTKGTTVTITDFNSALSDGWFNSDVLLSTLNEYGAASVRLSEICDEYGTTASQFLSGMDNYAKGTKTIDDIASDVGISVANLLPLFEEMSGEEYKLGLASFRAAQEAKTFSEAIDATKDAVSTGWMTTFDTIFGNYEEAKVLWTDLANGLWDVFAASGETRNEILALWKTAGGRDELIDAFWNLWDAIDSIVSPIKEAFGEIFPTTIQKSAWHLYNLTFRLRNFTESLILNEETADKIKRTFKGLFSILNIGKSILGVFIEPLKTLFGYLSNGSGSVLDMTANLGDMLVAFSKTVKSSKLLSDASNFLVKTIQFVANAISKLISCISGVGNSINLKGIIDNIKEFFDSFNNIDMSPVTAFTSSAEKHFSPLTTLFNGIRSIFVALWQLVLKLSPLFLGLATGIGNGLSSLGKSISDGVTNANFDSLFDLLNGGILVGIGLGIKKFIDNISGIAKDANKTFGSLKGILTSVKKCFEAYQKDIQANTLLKIAAAIGIITISLVALAGIDSQKLNGALMAITAEFGELIFAFKAVSKINSKGIMKTSSSLILIAGALLILSAACAILGHLNWDELQVGVTGLLGLATILTLTAATLSKTTKHITKGCGQLIALALSVLILTLAVKKLSQLNTEELLTGLVGIEAILFGLASFVKMTKKSGNIAGTAVGILILGAAMHVFASAVEKFGQIPIKELAIGLGAIAASLVVIGVAMKLLPKNTVGIGVGLLIVSSALVVMSNALQSLGKMNTDEISSSLLMLFSSLTILSVALLAMQKSIKGAAALIIAAGALAILTPVLKALGKMSLPEIGLALLSLSGVFAVLGISALLLTPLIPALLSLSGAIALFGLGIFAISAGVYLFAGALAALAVGGTAAIGMIVLAIESIIGLIPLILLKIGEGIINIITVIGGAGAAIFNAVKAILVSILEAIIAVIPSLIETIKAILQAIADNLPDILKFIFDILMTVLDAIAQNLKPIVGLVVDIIVEILGAIGENLPKIIQAGIDLVLAFIDGFGKGLVDNAEKIKDTFVGLFKNLLEAVLKLFGIHSPSKVFAEIGKNLILGAIQGLKDKASNLLDTALEIGGNIIEGIKNGITNGVESVVNAAKEMASKALSAAKEFLGIHSPSRAFAEVGRYSDEGLAKGLMKYSDKVYDASEEVATGALGGMSGVLSKIYDKINSDIDLEPTIKPVLDLSDITNGARTISSLLSSQEATYAANGYASLQSANQAASSVNSLNDILSKIDKKIEAKLASISDSSNIPVNVNVTLEGDSNGIFKVVKIENDRIIKSTGYNQLSRSRM